MPTAGASRTLVVLALLLAVAAAGLSACSLLGEDAPTPPSAASAPPDVVAGLRAALEERATAVRDRDARGFLAGLVAGDRGLRRAQRTYFDNLTQLPLGVFEYALDPADVVRDGEDYEVVVELRTQLSGFDVRAVASRDRMRLRLGGAGRYVVATATDPVWQAAHGVSPQPWDRGPVVVRIVPGVLGVFDGDSVDRADALLDDVRRGITDVSAAVPFDWSRSVVVYALSDAEFLASIPDLPGGDPRTLDGVAFPVPARAGRPALASTRFALHPRLLSHTGAGRSRLIRHELTHVALGRRDDHVPVWLSEGLAEYVSVRPLPPERRGISQSAVDAARAGFTDLPGDADFNDADARVHYGESWWACEYVATSLGEPSLWSLLGRLDDPDLDAADRNRVLQGWIGLGTRQLARRAGRLLLRTFEPPAASSPDRRQQGQGGALRDGGARAVAVPSGV